MENISSNLLSNTLNLIQLARETARARGVEGQVQRFEPVVQKLTSIVENERNLQPAPSVGVFEQGDFKSLLAIIQNKNTGADGNGNGDRRNIVQMMAKGGMNEVDIARQMGMTRDEVRVVVNMAEMKERS